MTPNPRIPVPGSMPSMRMLILNFGVGMDVGNVVEVFERIEQVRRLARGLRVRNLDGVVGNKCQFGFFDIKAASCEVFSYQLELLRVGIDDKLLVTNVISIFRASIDNV